MLRWAYERTTDDIVNNVVIFFKRGLNPFEQNKLEMGLNAEQIDRWLLDFYIFVHHKHRDKHVRIITYISLLLVAMIVCAVLLKLSITLK